MNLLGVVGYGMVGQALVKGFSKASWLISDPQHTVATISYMASKNPLAIFVCVPTPTDGSDFVILRDVLEQIKATGYTGLVVVKSTVLPEYLEGYDVLYNPEFLSRATAYKDFINPPLVIIGGPMDKAQQLADLYRTYSDVCMDRVKFMDVKTACLTKYTMNSFYALKLTYMNIVYDIANEIGADYEHLTDALKSQPWMGTHHFDVPGPDGKRGFGGPCLPKDTERFAQRYHIDILNTVLELNRQFRK